VDKSHLITLGERLYGDATELVRELVNNSYDADASRVRVEISPERVEVSDDGLGMDLEGLHAYFRVGASTKTGEPRSPRYGRARIGQFGIGKFASLAAASVFTLDTQRAGFRARVIFDKDAWSQSGESWDLPLEILTPDTARPDGTRVTLTKLNRPLVPAVVERVLVEGTPLRADHFEVVLNGHPVLPPSYPGQRIPIFEGCLFGPIRGEVVLLPESHASPEGMGLGVRVKGAMVARLSFGAEAWGREGHRIRGEVHADFLPVTSDRSGFVTSSEEYQAFARAMEDVMADVRAVLRRLGDMRLRRRASHALEEALQRLQRALARNPAFADLGASRDPPKRRARRAGAEPAPARDRKRPPRARPLTPRAVVKRAELGGLGVSCCIDHFGVDGPESFTEGRVVYLNSDHPLYVHESSEPALLTRHLVRLLAQEIALFQETRSPREAFHRQNQLLRDAFAAE
jgi:hypothetical protein